MNLNKRVSKLESETNWQPVYLAFVESDGSVAVSSAKKKLTLPSEDALNQWAEENGLNDSDQIRLFKVIIE